MQVVQSVAGFTLGRADLLRRALAKRNDEEVAQHRIQFVKGAEERSRISESKANQIFEWLERCAGYSLNKSHAVAYAMVAYQTAYLKANHPVEFLDAMTQTDGDAELRDDHTPGGLLGYIVPSGVYTDRGSTSLRRLFLNRCQWRWLFGFENRDGIFDIHRSFKFCPVIVAKGGETQCIQATFMRRNVDDWEQAEEHVLAYPRERVEQFSPSSLAMLEIHASRDFDVLSRMYAQGVLHGDENSDGWSVKYAREYDMTIDSKLFPPRPIDYCIIQ